MNDILSQTGRFDCISGVRVDGNLHRSFMNFSTTEMLQMEVASDPFRLIGMTLTSSFPRIMNADIPILLKLHTCAAANVRSRGADLLALISTFWLKGPMPDARSGNIYPPIILLPWCVPMQIELHVEGEGERQSKGHLSRQM
ncbi:RNA binding protein squid [Echinococcus multilocularis]|uniref:RNA binding protein squid n=1 Tax=Echinococcus multilocularis TaxID=6211 RepID=A0A0S4MLI4_ECHMU|nr:RNA binding protein squid [Echinococcus multilocularis]